MTHREILEGGGQIEREEEKKRRRRNRQRRENNTREMKERQKTFFDIMETETWREKGEK